MARKIQHDSALHILHAHQSELTPAEARSLNAIATDWASDADNATDADYTTFGAVQARCVHTHRCCR